MRDRTDARQQSGETAEYCRETNLDLVARYEDEEGSRAAFQRMMEDATSRQPPFDVVVVSRMVYFAVQIEESILAENHLKSNGVKVRSVHERRIPAD